MYDVTYVDCPYCGANNTYAEKDICSDGSVTIRCKNCHEIFSIQVASTSDSDVIPLYDLSLPQTGSLSTSPTSSEIVSEGESQTSE